MRFALLGVDADALTLAHYVARAPRHSLVWATDLGVAAAQVRAMAPDAVIASEWEALLSTTTADAVIVARAADEDARAEQLRKLVQEAVPLILVHPVHSSMLICYELDMIRRETGGIMLPYAPYRWHPAVHRAAELIAAGAAGPLGAVEQVVFERAMPERTRALVERQFAADVDLLRFLCGELTSIAALGSGGRGAAEEAAYANLGVQLTGESGLLARWSVSPAEHGAGANLLLRGARGKAVLHLTDAGAPTEMEIISAEHSERVAFDAFEPAAAAIDELERAIGGAGQNPTWPDACRDVELADALARSLKKGRTIELQDEEHSEHGTFKGTMTSLGCGLLLASLVALFVAAALARITGKPGFGYAPHAILAVLVVFLAIQSLKLVFRDDDERDK